MILVQQKMTCLTLYTSMMIGVFWVRAKYENEADFGYACFDGVCADKSVTGFAKLQTGTGDVAYNAVIESPKRLVPTKLPSKRMYEFRE